MLRFLEGLFMSGFLSALRTYPVGDANPAENFITEAWSWILSDPLISILKLQIFLIGL